MITSTQQKRNQKAKKSKEILAQLDELRLEKYEVLVEERFPYAQIRNERHDSS